MDIAAFHGHCPCNSVTWTVNTKPSRIVICHCDACCLAPPTKDPIAFSGIPNSSVIWSNGATSAGTQPAVESSTTSYIKVERTSDMAFRGYCNSCNALVHMKYHCEPGVTYVNMDLVDEESLKKEAHAAKFHIFAGSEAAAIGNAREGEEWWSEFNDNMVNTLRIWEEKGKPRREDL